MQPGLSGILHKILSVLYTVQSGMCGPPFIVQYYAVFFFYEQSDPECLTVNNSQ